MLLRLVILYTDPGRFLHTANIDTSKVERFRLAKHSQFESEFRVQQ